MFTGIGLSTVGYLRDLCSRLLMKRGVGLNSRPRIIATEVVIFQFSLYVQGTYFYKPKKQQSFKAKKISFDKDLDNH